MNRRKCACQLWDLHEGQIRVTRWRNAVVWCGVVSPVCHKHLEKSGNLVSLEGGHPENWLNFNNQRKDRIWSYCGRLKMSLCKTCVGWLLVWMGMSYDIWCSQLPNLLLMLSSRGRDECRTLICTFIGNIWVILYAVHVTQWWFVNPRSYKDLVASSRERCE